MGALLSGRGLTWDTWTAALHEIRTGKTISQATFDALQPIHEHLVSIHEMTQEDHATLADVLGLDNEPEDEVEALALPNHTIRARQQLAAVGR
jgi:hypothetical protein